MDPFLGHVLDRWGAVVAFFAVVGPHLVDHVLGRVCDRVWSIRPRRVGRRAFLCEPKAGVGPFLPGGRAAVGVVMVQHDDSARVARVWSPRCPVDRSTCCDARRCFDALSQGYLGRRGRREPFDAPPLARVVVGLAWRRARPLWAAGGREGFNGRLSSGAVRAVSRHFAPVHLSEVAGLVGPVALAVAQTSGPLRFSLVRRAAPARWSGGGAGGCGLRKAGAVGRVGLMLLYCGCR